MLCSVSERQFSSTVVQRKQQRRRQHGAVKSNGEYLAKRTKQGSYCNFTRDILLKWCVMVIRTYLHRGVKWYAYRLCSFLLIR